MPTMRGNHFNARSTACSDATRVAPVPSLHAMSSPTAASASVGSSAETGSSASRSSGCWYSARAMATRCSWPPESRSQRSNRRSARSSRASTSRAPAMSAGYISEASAFHVGQRPSRPASTAVTTRRRGGIGGTCWISAMRERSCLSARADTCQGFADSVSMRPSLGRSDVPMIRSSVVLPAPEGPITATRSPRATASATACNARCPFGCTRPRPFSASVIALPACATSAARPLDRPTRWNRSSMPGWG